MKNFMFAVVFLSSVIFSVSYAEQISISASEIPDWKYDLLELFEKKLNMAETPISHKNLASIAHALPAHLKGLFAREMYKKKSSIGAYVDATYDSHEKLDDVLKEEIATDIMQYVREIEDYVVQVQKALEELKASEELLENIIVNASRR